MRYKIMKAISFIFIFLFLLQTVSYILRPDTQNKRRFAGFYCQQEDSIDVIYIGSSAVKTYWAALISYYEYGFTSWPLAEDTEWPDFQLPTLIEALKTQKPKVVIFEMRLFTIGKDVFDNYENREAHIRNLTDNLKYSLNRFRIINNSVEDFSTRYNYYFDIMKYHSLWKNLSKSDWEYWDFERIDENGGLEIHDDVVDLSLDWNDYSSMTTRREIPFEQEIVLRELLDYCKKNGIIALFTATPYTDITEETQQMFNYMERIIDDEYGYNFINFNKLYNELDINFAADFYNGSHMNTQGAVKFTRYLSDYLVEHYDFEDKRGGYRI